MTRTETYTEGERGRRYLDRSCSPSSEERTHTESDGIGRSRCHLSANEVKLQTSVFVPSSTLASPSPPLPSATPPSSAPHPPPSRCLLSHLLLLSLHSAVILSLARPLAEVLPHFFNQSHKLLRSAVSPPPLRVFLPLCRPSSPSPSPSVSAAPPSLSSSSLAAFIAALGG